MQEPDKRLKQPTTEPDPKEQTAKHSTELIVCKSESRLQSFFLRTIREWNGLPKESMTACLCLAGILFTDRQTLSHTQRHTETNRNEKLIPP